MVQVKKVAPGVSYEKDKGSSLCHFGLSWLSHRVRVVILKNASSPLPLLLPILGQR